MSSQFQKQSRGSCDNGRKHQRNSSCRCHRRSQTPGETFVLRGEHFQNHRRLSVHGRVWWWRRDHAATNKSLSQVRQTFQRIRITRSFTAHQSGTFRQSGQFGRKRRSKTTSTFNLRQSCFVWQWRQRFVWRSGQWRKCRRWRFQQFGQRKRGFSRIGCNGDNTNDHSNNHVRSTWSWLW